MSVTKTRSEEYYRSEISRKNLAVIRQSHSKLGGRAVRDVSKLVQGAADLSSEVPSLRYLLPIKERTRKDFNDCCYCGIIKYLF